MNFSAIVIAIVALTALTTAYKLIPYREIRDRKPRISFFSKFRKIIRLKINNNKLQSKLGSIGFKKVGTMNGYLQFYRGSSLGDFSVKLLKVKLQLNACGNDLSEFTLEAGWIAVFDTGDF
jgi:hypothetical protein